MNNPNLRKWTEAKLEKEMCFAEACKGDDERTLAWWQTVKAEWERRNQMAYAEES